MVSVFRFSLPIPPRTPLKGRKIFVLGFFRKSHERCIFASRFRIWSRISEIPTRSRLIRVLVPIYYVIVHFFAFRAPLPSLFFVLRSMYWLPSPRGFFWCIMVTIPVVRPEMFSLLIFGYARFSRFSRRFSISFLILRQFASQTLIVWGGCRSRPALCCRDLSHFD